MSSVNDPDPTQGSGRRRNPFYLAGAAVLLVVMILRILIFTRLRAQNRAGTPPLMQARSLRSSDWRQRYFWGGRILWPRFPWMTPNLSHSISRQTPAEDGEAVIKGQVEGASCSIFIFFDTRLQRSACNQAASDGNTTCLEEGSAVFENCHNHLVQTASGKVKLLGTWASVTYLPDQKLTLLAVTEGETSVQPVLDDGEPDHGIPVEVGAGEYYIHGAGSRIWFRRPGCLLARLCRSLGSIRSWRNILRLLIGLPWLWTAAGPTGSTRTSLCR